MAFNRQKVIQVVNLILKKYDFRLNYTKLIKILYILDKEALRRWDVAVTGDSYCSMDNGPVLSNIYDLIMGRYDDETIQQYWENHFVKHGYDLVSINGDKIFDDELSRREEELIDSIDSQFHDKDYKYMIRYVHLKKLFPEWQDPQGSSIPLYKKDLLKSIGRTDEEIDEILEEENQLNQEEMYLISHYR